MSTTYISPCLPLPCVVSNTFKAYRTAALPAFGLQGLHAKRTAERKLAAVGELDEDLVMDLTVSWEFGTGSG